MLPNISVGVEVFTDKKNIKDATRILFYLIFSLPEKTTLLEAS